MPQNEANHSEATRGAQNQPPRRPLVSIQKPHASGKQHAFPFSLAYKGHPLILAQAAGPVGGAGAGLGLLPPRTGPKASRACSFNARGLSRKTGTVHWGQGSPGAMSEASACGGLVPGAWPLLRQPGFLLHPNSSPV